MAPLAESMDPIELPDPSVWSVKKFVPDLVAHPDTQVPKILEPYKAFEADLRRAYAQQPNHQALKDGKINLIPVFNDGNEEYLKVRARSLDSESDDEKSRYIMDLKDEDRKPDGASAVVSSFKDFQQNFNLFSESSLSELDWNNVVAAGSSVTTALLPVPKKWAGNKRSMREYYHEHLAPASDVDLFLYGLNEEQALKKIKQIERNIKDSILHETTTIRTKNAITIASQYPTRHVQIVLRLYDSISQIITGFDVDCACVAYDGSQVYAAPRALAAFVTQCNTIDLTRRSPSYENRLSKYSRRGFEVHWPLLDRTRIDPTIFERSFGRTQGLARLLILEKLPKSVDRDNYMDQRRAERGRPALHRNYYRKMGGNIKDQEEDDIAEWVDHEEVASYHTMTVPYGPKYHAARINRLLYAKDLLLNAEWNKPEDREVHLHRHPCFIGTAEEVLQDCCGYCPVPKTDEEIDVAEEEAKIYISGPLKFITDDPGRQEIGSFNPITDDEWTTMAYVGDTARLCQAIVEGDLEHVEDWCSQEGVDVNRRDYTGRTPLHLAVMASTVEIVQCLIDHGARLVARLVDGRTALHLAAARGSKEMVKALMDRSLANEEEQEEKIEARRAARKAEKAKADAKADDEMSDIGSEASEITLDSEESDSMTMGSFVKVDDAQKKPHDDGVPEDSTDEPDFYEVDVIAWDYGLSSLHLAILNGHLEIIDLLVSEYGADVLLPVKLVDPGSKNARGAIMTILLAMTLPTEKAKGVVKLLLELGATSAQADMNHISILHYVVAQDNHEILDMLLANDRPVALSVINWMSTPKWSNQGDSPLTTAIEMGHQDMVSKLLAIGAKPEISFDSWIKTYLEKNPWARNQSSGDTKKQFNSTVIQPVISAAAKELGKIVEALVSHGANPSTLERSAYNVIQTPDNARHTVAESLLDIIQKKLRALEDWQNPTDKASQQFRHSFMYSCQPMQYRPKKPEKLRDEASYMEGLKPGTYEFWTAQRDYQATKQANDKEWEVYENYIPPEAEKGLEEKKLAVAKLIEELEHAEKTLIEAGAKTFAQLYPDIPKKDEFNQHFYPQPTPTFYVTTQRFRIPDLNDTKKEGYIKLFEAAFNNDLETIKALTLGKWASEEDMPLNSPLKIAVQDGNGFSPFSIAVLRGHRELARKIVEICATQYHEDDGLSSRQRFRTAADSDDEDLDSDNEDGLPIFSELVSDKFTIENLGEVSNIVKSDVLPLTMIEWACAGQRFLDSEKSKQVGEKSLLQHAVEEEDMDLLKFIIELGGEQKALLAEEEDDQKCYTIDRAVFYTAIRLGRTTMLAEMIKATGVGIPLNELIAKSGVELKTKPRYYQGLSVGGKKRADWAQAPGSHQHIIEEKTPPLLQAAKFGSIESVEWFMSDAPLRRYKEFAEKNSHDKRIKTLEQAKGFDKTINSWLTAKTELVLHCAILYNPNKKNKHPEYLALIKHIVSVLPDSLEQKTSEGWTPLHLAVYIHREDVVSYLISIGANQRSRDKAGRNVAHSMLVSQNHSVARTKAKEIQKLLELFDKDALKEMLLERCNQAPGALTPLAYWMAKNNGSYKKDKVVKILTSYSSGEELEMINGEGDLPLHAAIKQGLSTIIAFLLSLNPSLLHRENSTGRTPLEMSRDIYIASQVNNAPNYNKSNYNYHYYAGQHDHSAVVNRAPQTFIVKKGPEESKKRTWEICVERDESLGERKRRLVSLFEANEVARRVAGLKRGGGGVFNAGVAQAFKMDIASEWASLL